MNIKRGRKKTALTIDYRKDLLDRLRDPKYAVLYLNAALEEKDDPGAFLLALRNVSEVHGIRKTTQEAKLNRGTFYRIVSKKGNPTIQTLYTLLDVLGFQLKVDVSKAEKFHMRKAA